MKSKLKTGDTAAELRKLAEETFSVIQAERKKPLTPAETEQLLHELGVHQIELEMQNEELRRAQTELEESRARYFDLYDLAPVGYLTVSEKGLILEANLTAGTLLGIARGGLLNQPISRFIFKEDQDIYYQHRMKLFVVGASFTCELRLTKPDGCLLWVQLNSIASRNAEGALVSHIALSDITESKIAVEALREKETLLNTVIQTIPIGLWLADAEGKLVIGNAAGQKVWEGARYVGKEQYGEYKGWWTETGERIKPEEWALFRAISNGETSIEEMIDIECFDGSRKTILNSAVPIKDAEQQIAGAIVINQDITDRKIAEEALRGSEEQFRTLVNMAPIGIYLSDPKGNCDYVNQRWCEIAGMDLPDALGFGWINGLHPEDRELVFNNWHQMIASNGTWGLEYRFKRPDNRVTWVYGLATPVRDAMGKIVQYIGANMDITERKRMEEERDLIAKLFVEMSANVNLHEIMRSVTTLLHKWSGCNAVAIRLNEGDDYPYYETSGFPAAFVEKERTVCAYDLNGQLLLDCDGNPVLECMCGNILRKRYDPSKPFFTARGSFWSNNTTALLASTTEADRQSRTRNRCNGEGYESVALIGLQSGGEVLGLLQFNDFRTDRFTPELINLLERLSDIIALALSERRERDNHQKIYNRLQSICNNSTDAIYVKDIEGRYLFFNNEAARASGKSPDEVIGKDDRYIFPIHEAETVMAGDRQVMESCRVKTYEEVVTTVDRVVTYLSTKGPVFDQNGNITGLFGIARDITERKQAEDELRRLLQEKTVMLKEIHHRVKNNMQVISSLLNLQAHTITDDAVRALFEESRGRISSMALIHERLYRSEDFAHVDFKEYLQSLMSDITQTYKRTGVTISVEMESVALDVNVGIPCGLIVNELVTNSLKHAFPDGRKGTIRVGITSTGEGNNILVVSDDGIGFPASIDFRNTTSLGLKLVNVLIGQIHGTVEMSVDGGTKFNITFSGGGGGKSKLIITS